MKSSEILKYYSNRDLRQKIVKLCKDREVASRFKDGGFGKRPQLIMYESEILNFVKQGASSFHASEERWSNPVLLKSDMTLKELSNLRTGWDLIIDIDTKKFEYAKLCANLIIKALRFHNLRNYSIKFSGGTGFHIGINWESFPEKINNVDSHLLFPDTPMIIASYLQALIKESLSNEILAIEGDLNNISKKTGKPHQELVEKTDDGEKFNPYSLIQMDTVALSSRHLIRMPYVFNEKTWLISQPCESPLEFDREMAKPENLNLEIDFLQNYKEGEAKQLVIEAYDWWAMRNEEEETNKGKVRQFTLPEEAIPEKFFPPCVKLITNGLSDGRKRAVFILINFLRSSGWDINSIESFVLEVNKKNSPPLRENYIRSQIQHQKRVKTPFPPPNCLNKGYMIDMGICKPDNLCSKIKNPATYILKKSGFKRK